MPICSGCGASYDANFKFCPYCGKAKPEPEVLNINVQYSPKKYEEASLKIEFISKEEVTEYPFDWRPNLFDKIQSDTGHNWTEVSHFRFILVSIHPEKGEYVAFESNSFRAFYALRSAKPVKFPIRIRNMLTYQPMGQKWIEDFFSKRKQAWEQLNWFLIEQGWTGLTQKAINRIPPFDLQMHPGWLTEKRTGWLENDGCLIIGGYSRIEDIGSGYRYQCQLR